MFLRLAESEKKANRGWTQLNSMYYVVSVITSVGYGGKFLLPTTTLGRLLLVPIFTLGTSLLMTFLARSALSLEWVLRLIYSRLCCRWFRSRRKQQEMPLYYQRKQLKNRLIDERIGQESWLKTSAGSMAIPAVLSVGFILLFFTLGMILFMRLEGWSHLEAVYYMVLTLTSVGLGNVLPEKALKRQQTIEMLSICFFPILG